MSTAATNTQQKIINRELVTAMGEVLCYKILSIYFDAIPSNRSTKIGKTMYFRISWFHSTRITAWNGK